MSIWSDIKAAFNGNRKKNSGDTAPRVLERNRYVEWLIRIMEDIKEGFYRKMQKQQKKGAVEEKENQKKQQVPDMTAIIPKTVDVQKKEQKNVERNQGAIETNRVKGQTPMRTKGNQPIVEDVAKKIEEATRNTRSSSVITNRERATRSGRGDEDVR